MSRLAEIFRELGADEPDSWARSQEQEGIPQLHRYLFLRAAWGGAVEPGNNEWMDNLVAEKDGCWPVEDARDALSRLLEAGADRVDLTRVVRWMQTSMLFHVCYQMGCPDPVEVDGVEICWDLFAIDEAGKPGVIVDALHESVLETNPLGAA